MEDSVVNGLTLLGVSKEARVYASVENVENVSVWRLEKKLLYSEN